MRRPIWGLIVGLSLTGCGEGEPLSSSGFERFDSAGIQIVEVRTIEDLGAAAQVVAEPDLEIGALEGMGADVFGSVASTRQLPNGTIAVADGQAGEVRLFGSDGAHLATFGAAGSGPGEFEQLHTILAARDDSIWTWDTGLQRVTVFRADGIPVESLDLPIDRDDIDDIQLLQDRTFLGEAR